MWNVNVFMICFSDNNCLMYLGRINDAAPEYENIDLKGKLRFAYACQLTLLITAVMPLLP